MGGWKAGSGRAGSRVEFGPVVMQVPNIASRAVESRGGPSLRRPTEAVIALSCGKRKSFPFTHKLRRVHIYALASKANLRPMGRVGSV